MYAAKIHTALASLLSRTGALAALVVTAVALVAAVPAGATDNNGPAGKPGKCAVEDQNGNVSYVDAGTRIGLFVCGSDGEWHFGWLVTGFAPTQPTVTSTAIAPTATKAL